MRLGLVLRSAALTAVIADVTVTAAHAFDLTGHWVGKWTCKGFDGAKFTDQNKTSTLDITQSGAVVHARFEQAFAFDGVAIPDAKKPDKGEAVLLDCQTNAVVAAGDGNSEVIRASVATKPMSANGVLRGLSVLENNVVPFGQQVQTCKYSYHRVSTGDPAVGGCP